MAQDVNGIVYLAGKEKAITKGFFGNTVNPEIVFLFVNKNGKKYYINYDILRNLEGKEDIVPGKYYEINRIDRGRKLSFKESKKTFDEKVIKETKEDKTLGENIEFNNLIISREMNAQIEVRKKRNIVLDLIGLLLVLIVFSFTKNILYSIPFIVILVCMIIWLLLYNRKMVNKIRRI